MNERIDKLIEQCTTQQFSDCVGGYENFDKEKFAELILFECVKIAVFKGDTETAKEIKEHFGLK